MAIFLYLLHFLKGQGDLGDLFGVVNSTRRLSVARDARPEAALFVDQTIQVVPESRDQRKVFSPIGLAVVVVEEPDISQGIFEVLLIHEITGSNV